MSRFLQTLQPTTKKQPLKGNGDTHRKTQQHDQHTRGVLSIVCVSSVRPKGTPEEQVARIRNVRPERLHGLATLCPSPHVMENFKMRTPKNRTCVRVYRELTEQKRRIQ